jgi:hypothetical protein
MGNQGRTSLERMIKKTIFFCEQPLTVLFPVSEPHRQTATEIGNSGIGDTPYVIDANNVDRYPFMTQNAVAEFPSFLIPSLVITTTLVSAIIYRRKRSI